MVTSRHQVPPPVPKVLLPMQFQPLPTCLQAYSAANNVTETSMISILWDFGYLFLASLALGMTFGLGIAFMLKLLRSRDSPQASWQHVHVRALRGSLIICNSREHDSLSTT